jgi:sortase (surface protein transpeptidase)
VRARQQFFGTTVSPDLRQKSQKLIHKFAKKHTNDQKIVFDASQKQAQPQRETKAEIQAAYVSVTPSRSWQNKLFTLLMSLSFIVIVALFGPVTYFRFFGHEVVPVQTTEAGSVLGGTFEQPAVEEKKISQPPRDETLPEGSWLAIPRIGVRTEILESEDPEESLVKGVWRAPDFGLPGDAEQPVILAAHRYGYNWWWKGEYWKYHSFYLLPDLEPGDLVEVIHDKRKYLYEIYAGEEGTEITDYNADMILYTCKFLTSDIRHFRYARLIDPSKYSDFTTKLEASPSSSTQL